MWLRDVQDARWLVLRATGFLALLTAIPGCVAPGGDHPGAGSPGAQTACSNDFQRVITPFKIDGGHELYFSYQDLGFLLDQGLDIQSIALELTAKGKYK